MKSRTLSCKATPFWKDVTRFAPLWAVYFIGGLLVLLTATASYGTVTAQVTGSAAENLSSSMGVLAVVNMLYAAVTAQLVFGDLYQSRLCFALHALPLRRERWFISHVASGICFSFVPHLAVSLVMLTRTGGFWYIPLYWLLGMSLQYLFFFGLAVFSALCVGNRAAQAAVYGILNFGAVIVYWFCDTIFLPMMHGVVLSEDEFFRFSPVIRQSAVQYFEWESYRVGTGITSYRRYEFEGLITENWSYLWICAGIGILFLGAAYLLYRRRALESAGDFIAVKGMKPVFSVVFTLCVGAVFSAFSQLFSDAYLWVFFVVGIVLGYFISQMLLQRTAKVFKPKAFVRLGILAAVMVLSLLLAKWDVFGIVRWVPQPEKVEKVEINSNFTVTDPEHIRLITQLHGMAVEMREDAAPTVGERASIYLHYTLKSGAKAERIYLVNARSPEHQALKGVYSSLRVVLGEASTDWEAFQKSVISVSNGQGKLYLSQEETAALLEAIKKDCQAGNMAQDNTFHQGKPLEYLTLEYGSQSQNRRQYLEIYAEAEHTVAFLRQHHSSEQNLLGYSGSWEDFLKHLHEVNYNGMEISEAGDRISLMEALQQDCRAGNITGMTEDAIAFLTVTYGNPDDYHLHIRDIPISKNCTHVLEWIVGYSKNKNPAGN